MSCKFKKGLLEFTYIIKCLTPVNSSLVSLNFYKEFTMKKYFAILLFNSGIFLYGGNSVVVRDLVLLNNHTLDSGNYKDRNLYKIDNSSFGREFSFVM